ncbi:MAG: glycosyltransferase family 39 protein [Terrimicrobiaceae bacterium]
MISRTGAVGLLLLATFLLHVATAGWGNLYNETDGQYAGASKVMAAGGDWLVPENNGIPRLVKPPLLYWAMAASMSVAGINEFAARLPGALSLVIWVGLTYLLGSHWGGHRRGLWAGGILATMLGSFTLARIVMPEPLFTALIAGALLTFLKASQSNHAARWMVGFWVLGGLAAFVKGPHGLIYPVVIAGIALLGPRIFGGKMRWRARAMFPISGLLLAALINLPWYFYIEAKFPGFLTNLIFTEHLGHVTGTAAPATNYSNVPRWTFLLLHLAWFFPWSLAALFALPKALRHLPSPSAWSLSSWLVMSWVFAVGLSVMLAGQRQDYYAMTLWPAFALGAAWLIEKSSLRTASFAVAGVLLLALLACLAAPRILAGSSTAAVADRATALSTVLQFGPEVWQGLMMIAAVSLTLAIGFSLAAAFAKVRAFGFLAVAGACLGLGAIAGTAKVAPFFSLGDIATTISAGAGEKGIIVFDGDIDTGSSLLFYLDREIYLLGANPDADHIVRTRGLGTSRFLKKENLLHLWQSPSRIIFITESSRLPEWQRVLGPIVPIATCGTMVALTNTHE